MSRDSFYEEDEGLNYNNDPRIGNDSRSRYYERTKKVASNPNTWIYVIVFILLFLIFVFVILIYAKVKGFTLNPTALGTASSLRKPGKVFTGRASTSEVSEVSEE